MDDNVYVRNGYKNRKDYLRSLAKELDIDESTVFSVASILGEDEDFDGLVSCIEDYTENYW